MLASEHMEKSRKEITIMRIVKKAMAIMIAVTVTAGMVTMNLSEAKASNEKSTVTISVEKFTIGQGYVVEPTVVEIEDGDTTSSVLTRILDENGYTYTTQSTWGFYLESIDYADTGIVNIPAEISAMESYRSSYESGGEIIEYGYDAPSNENNDGNVLEKSALGQYSYNGMAGWLITLNGAATPSSSEPVKDGDVIRWQFSVYAWGGDIGLAGNEEYTGITTLQVANKEELTKAVANVNSNKDKLLKNANVKNAYDRANAILTKLLASQDEVDNALSKLNEAIAEVPTETESVTVLDPTTQPTTAAIAPTTANQQQTETVANETTTSKQTVGRAVINSVKNTKTRRAKISVKKVSKAAGYQYKYSTSKNFKKAVTKVKTTTKTSIVTKKLKKNQKCYVKVRAYIKVNGVRVYGKWSKVKYVKIRK